LITALLVVLGIALGQAELPEDLNVQLFHPSIDAEQTLWTDDAHLSPNGMWSVRSLFHYTYRPLMLQRADGDLDPLVDHLLQLDLMGAWTTEPVRFGAYVPIYLRSIDAGGQRTGLGDLAFDIRGTVARREDVPVALAFAARLSLPTTTVHAPLGHRSIGLEAETIADLQAGPALLAVNLGYRTAKRVELANITWNDQLFARFGAGLPVSDRFGFSLDLAGHLNLFEVNKVAYPAEVLLGGWGVAAPGLVVRGAVGTGFTPGIGAPRFRAMLGIGWEARPEPEVVPEAPAIVVPVEPPPMVEAPEPEVVPEPEEVVPEPEEVVPEPTQVTIRAVDVAGLDISSAEWRVMGDTDATGHSGDTVGLPAGTYTIEVWAAGHAAITEQVAIPEEPSHALTYVLADLIPPGQLVVGVFDVAGNPLPEARVSVDEADLEAVPPETTLELIPGAYTLRASLAGHLDAVRRIEVPPDGVLRVELVLAPSRVVVTAQRIELSELVYFDTNKATIRPESFVLLDQVASTLLDHPELARVRVEGHTDSRGSAAYNLDLSQRRADSVRDYLVERGVAPSRLEAVGFGETEPLDTRETPEAWAKNRRVDLFIIERAGE